MADGILPSKLLLLRLNSVMLRKGVKLNRFNVPFSSKPERSIRETSPMDLSQTMEVQLQRLLMLERDHELREDGEGDKLFFHWIKSCACVLGEELIFNGNKVNNNSTKRRQENGGFGTVFMVLY